MEEKDLDDMIAENERKKSEIDAESKALLKIKKRFAKEKQE